jgi:hypothetical protein
MKIIAAENFSEGTNALGHFLGLIYRFLRDGEIFKSQTTYLPLDFAWIDFIDVEVAAELDSELEEDVLQLGAALAAISWLDDQYSLELFTEQRENVIERLSASKHGQLLEFRQFVESLNIPNNFDGVQSALQKIYKKYVEKWWINQIK